MVVGRKLAHKLITWVGLSGTVGIGIYIKEAIIITAVGCKSMCQAFTYLISIKLSDASLSKHKNVNNSIVMKTRLDIIPT